MTERVVFRPNSQNEHPPLPIPQNEYKMNTPLRGIVTDTSLNAHPLRTQCAGRAMLGRRPVLQNSLLSLRDSVLSCDLKKKRLTRSREEDTITTANNNLHTITTMSNNNKQPRYSLEGITDEQFGELCEEKLALC